VKKPHDAAAKHALLAVFGVVSLDHANPAQRFGESSRHLGVDLSPLAKNRTNRLKSFLKRQSETEQEPEGQRRHQRTDPEQHNQRNTRGEQSTYKIYKASADQVTHAFHITHDSRYQNTALGRIVERHGQPPDMRLYFLSQLGN